MESMERKNKRVGVRLNSNQFQAYCQYCGDWRSAPYNDREFAYDMLARHVNKQEHRTNAAAPTRGVA